MNARSLALTLALALFSLPAAAAKIQTLDVKVRGIETGEKIPKEFAYCTAGKDGKHAQGENARPKINWEKGPKGTKSYAIVVVDPDVPADMSEANKEGVNIAENASRQPFYHWAQVDIPAEYTSLARGGGRGAIKEQPPHGLPAVNDYAKFMNASPSQFIGYDGPCPPWNDMRMHHYHFMVMALDVASLELPQGFTAREAYAAMRDHVLAKGKVIGLYSTNSRR